MNAKILQKQTEGTESETLLALRPSVKARSPRTPQLPALNDADFAPMTTAEVAKELGYSAAKVRKIAASELGGYRSNSGQGCAWRFPRARVMDFKRRSEVGEQKSEASTVQELARELADLVQVSKQRETDLRYELEKLERRLSQVEAQADGRRERIAA